MAHQKSAHGAMEALLTSLKCRSCDLEQAQGESHLQCTCGEKVMEDPDSLVSKRVKQPVP